MWRTKEPNEHGFVEDSWVRGQKHDGDVHKNIVLSDRTLRNERGTWSTNYRAVNHARVAGDIKGKRHSPT